MTYAYVKIIKDPIQISRRRWNADGRGALVECLRGSQSTLPFGQAYVTTVNPGIIKAWHLHKKQTDRMMVIRGIVRFAAADEKTGVVLMDFIVDSSDPYLITIPPGLLHGFQNLGNDVAYIINVPDAEYDAEEPDELRYHYDMPKVNFPWLASIHG